MNQPFTPDQLQAGRRLFNGAARFRLGVAQLEQLPEVRGIEIAFAGRSNVGKSSLINGLTGVNGLARAFVLIDSRHGVMTPDIEMFEMLDDAAVPYQLVITKCDKINRHELAELEAETQTRIAKRAAAIQAIHLTSAERGFGMDELRAEVAGLVTS